MRAYIKHAFAKEKAEDFHPPVLHYEHVPGRCRHLFYSLVAGAELGHAAGLVGQEPRRTCHHACPAIDDDLAVYGEWENRTFSIHAVQLRTLFTVHGYTATYRKRRPG